MSPEEEAAEAPWRALVGQVRAKLRSELSTSCTGTQESVKTLVCDALEASYRLGFDRGAQSAARAMVEWARREIAKGEASGDAR